MIRVPVESSNLKSVGWEDDTLEVEFAKGRIYQYTGVPASMYLALMQAESKGKFFAENIRDAYSYQRIA